MVIQLNTASQIRFQHCVCEGISPCLLSHRGSTSVTRLWLPHRRRSRTGCSGFKTLQCVWSQGHWTRKLCYRKDDRAMPHTYAYPGTAQFFWVPSIISGTCKATYFKFWRNIHRVDRNKSPWKMLGIVAVGVVRKSWTFSGHHIGRIARSSLRQHSFLVLMRHWKKSPSHIFVCRY